MFNDPVTVKIADFLTSIGIEVTPVDLSEKTFLPGILVDHGALRVDEAKLVSPGDILHEAGHLAVTPTEKRGRLYNDVSKNAGDELATIAWSWAATLHLGIDPALLFHPHGYRGGSDSLLENFSEGRYFGVPLLQWMGLTWEENLAQQHGVPPFPHMLKWLRD
jgi:hypothetical protein